MPFVSKDRKEYPSIYEFFHTKMRTIFFIVTFFAFVVLGKVFGQTPVPQIIPLPVKMEILPGSFQISANTAIYYNNKHPNLLKHATYLSTAIQSISGIHPAIVTNLEVNRIRLLIGQSTQIGAEGYHLTIDPSGISIIANTDKGIFYGIQTLLQALPGIRTNQKLIVKNLKITDYPRFGWRGMMLDVSRHFFSTVAIKNYIDLMAMYKVNVFHWHLTDDEGWRLEIKKYPKLTQIGAWRKEVRGSVFYKKNQVLNQADTFTYGGYYTQQQAKEIVAYASERNITVIPEIEMPGHSQAVIAAYPQLSCSGQPQQVRTSMGVLSGAQANYCAGKEESFTFLEDVMKEVIKIFPAPYIHIGGDEVDKTTWKNCTLCQQRMKNESLKDEHELQSYFISRMGKFLKANNRQLIGWDEILEGGLPNDAIVMSWRGEKGGIAASKLNHYVVMTPVKPLYFNRYQADTLSYQQPLAARFSINTLKNVYDYEPIPKELSISSRPYVLGSQGCLWTEFIPSVHQLEQMTFPRMIALSEVMWSPVKLKNWEDFSKRLDGHLNRLGEAGVNFFSAEINNPLVLAKP
ncbi:hypothetical protein GCM10022246_01380 [Pedobacter ginsengiterrae]|uniref:beta-N-acetylhexosaminidase n=1 Tax=Pedobacter ginsengiterrae TaxID=871696 RepID=A0ABP7NMY2_9SPHI